MGSFRFELGLKQSKARKANITPEKPKEQVFTRCERKYDEGNKYRKKSKIPATTTWIKLLLTAKKMMFKKYFKEPSFLSRFGPYAIKVVKLKKIWKKDRCKKAEVSNVCISLLALPKLSKMTRGIKHQEVGFIFTQDTKYNATITVPSHLVTKGILKYQVASMFAEARLTKACQNPARFSKDVRGLLTWFPSFPLFSERQNMALLGEHTYSSCLDSIIAKARDVGYVLEQVCSQERATG